MQDHCLHPKCMQVLDADNLFASIGFSIIARIQSVSSAFNYCIKALMDAGIHAVKLNESIGCRQSVASIGFSINPFILSVSSACSYPIKAAMDAGIYAAKLNACNGCNPGRQWCRG